MAGAPWAELLAGLGRCGDAAALTIAIDPDDGSLKLTLRLGGASRLKARADMELTAAEAQRVGRRLAALVDTLDHIDGESVVGRIRGDLVIDHSAPIGAADVAWLQRLLAETGVGYLVAQVALIRALMRPGADG